MTRTGMLVASLLASALIGADNDPQFTPDGGLARPRSYREWVFLSSGLGMTYGPLAAGARDNPRFDNVFVSRAAYQGFLETGQWPDKTILVLEVRSSESRGSINRDGHFQGELVGLEAEVKAGGKWSFYRFDAGSATGKRWPNTATCYACHAEHGAVDNTFVQFYPTLLEVAKAKRTLAEGRQ